MQSKIPSQSLIWSDLASRFQAELELQKSRIWRLSGFAAEYGGPAEGDLYLERELMVLIEELAGLLVQTAALDAENRQFANCSRRCPGRPKNMAPFLASRLLSVFQRCHDRAGRQSVVVGTTIEGKPKQAEAGELYSFIETVIQPLNQYLTTELHRGSLSASRMARDALADHRRMTRALKRSEAKPSANEPIVANKRQLHPFEAALQEVFAMPK